jgi:hypothetical protein
MIKIGDKELVLGKALIVSPGLSVEIDELVTYSLVTTPPVVTPPPSLAGPPQPERLRVLISIKFRDKIEGEEEGSIFWAGDRDSHRISFEFIGWQNPLGQGMVKPQKLGDVKGLPFGFQAISHRVGTVSLLHFHLFIGGSDYA